MRETPTLKFYKAPTDIVVVGIRGTVPTDSGDLKADALIGLNKLETSNRFKTDLATLQSFQRQWPQSKYKYIGVGHSLGGAILDSFLEMGLLSRGVSYNPAVQPKNFAKMAGANERIYAKNDPLYAVMGRQLTEKPELRDVRDKNIFEKALDYVPYVGKVYDSYQGHLLDQFEGGGLFGRRRNAIVPTTGPLVQTKETAPIRGAEGSDPKGLDTRDSSQISPGDITGRRDPWYVRLRKRLFGFGNENKGGWFPRGELKQLDDIDDILRHGGTDDEQRRTRAAVKRGFELILQHNTDTVDPLDAEIRGIARHVLDNAIYNTNTDDAVGNFRYVLNELLPQKLYPPVPTIGAIRKRELSGKGKGAGGNKFEAQLKKAGLEPSAYLAEARRRAKENGYPFKLLGFASDGVHKLAIPDENGRVVAFGKVGYGDHLIYSQMEAAGTVASGTAKKKQRTFQRSHLKIKGDWQKNPFSPNNLALKILW